MNTTSIAHAAGSIRTHLRKAASQAEDSVAMQAIARTMAHLEAAIHLILAGGIEVVEWYSTEGVTRGPRVITIQTTTTVIGAADHAVAWSCTCGGDARAYQGACVHLLTGRVLRDTFTISRWQDRRAERRAALDAAFAAEAAAICAVTPAKAAYDAALAVADQASMARIAAQQAVWRDDAEAHAHGLSDPDDSGHAAALLMGSVAA